MTSPAGVADQVISPRIGRLFKQVFSFPVMLSGLLSVLALLTVRSRFDDPDMWWHLKMGEIIWTTHKIPSTDIFSYTTNHHAYVAHEWLSQLVIYGAYRFGGYSGLMLWLWFFTSAILIGGYALCSAYSGNSKIALLGALAIWFFATIGLAIRPQMVGYLFLEIELLLLHLGRTRNPRWFFGLAPLFAIWINCHGSFFLGLIVVGIFLFSSFFEFQLGYLVSSRWESKQRRTLTWAFTLSIAALFLNPIGVNQLLYPLQTLFHLPVNLSQVEEWQPLQLGDQRGLGLLVILGAILLLAIVRQSELLWDELLLLTVGTWLAAGHRRMLFPFGILAAPILSRLLSTSWDNYDPERDRPVPNAVFIAISFTVAVMAFPDRQNLASQVEHLSPVNAVEFINSHHLSGHMLNEYVYGGYLIWAAPEHPVFVDGRGDVFEETGILGEFGNWATLKSPPHDLLDKYQIDFCLLTRNSPMASVMALLPAWNTIYSDNQSVIFARIATAYSLQ